MTSQGAIIPATIRWAQQRVCHCRARRAAKRSVFDEPNLGTRSGAGRRRVGVMRTLANDGMTMIVGRIEMEFAKDVADAAVIDAVSSSSGSGQAVLNQPQQRCTQILAASAASALSVKYFGVEGRGRLEHDYGKVVKTGFSERECFKQPNESGMTIRR